MEKKKNKKNRGIIVIAIILVLIALLLLLKSCSNTNGNGKQDITKYEVTFLNIDGSILQKSSVENGKLPEYKAETPSYEDDTYNYSFLGWDKEIVIVSSNQTYNATYEKTKKETTNNDNQNPDDTRMTPVVNVDSVNTTLTYNGQNQDLLKSISTTGGTLQYKIGDGTYSTSLPQAMDAGEYIIYYKVIGNEQYKDGKEASIRIVINKLKVDLPTSATDLVYNGQEQIGVSCPIDAKYTITSNKAKNAGSYTATLTLKDKKNCEWNLKNTSDDQTISWSIAKKSINVIAQDQSSYVGSDLATLTYNYDALCSGDSFTGVLSTTASKTTTGTYDITIGTLTAGENYTISFTKATYTIKAKENQTISFTNSSLTKTYGDSNFTQTVTGAKSTVSYSSSDTSIATINSSTGEVTIVKAGTVTITATATESEAYNKAETTYSITINKATPTVTAPTGKTKMDYTGLTQDLIVAGSTNGGTLQYALGTSTAPTGTFSTTVPSSNKASTYYIWYKVVGNDNYNSVDAQMVTTTFKGYDIEFDFASLETPKAELSDTYFIVYFADGTQLLVSPSGSGGLDITIGPTEGGLEGYEMPYTISNIVAIDRADNYMTYRNKGETNEYTYDFGSGEKILTNDISIKKTGRHECIDENTMITMADGSLKAMKEIEVGDMVLSIDYETMTLVARKVIFTGKDEDDYDNWTVSSYYLHTFSDGTTIKRAMNHRFYCLEDQSYEYMHTWSNGEHTYKIDGTNPYLVSTEIIQEEIHYGRITLEGSNNYFANGLSTGDRNCCPNKVTLDELLEKANK